VETGAALDGQSRSRLRTQNNRRDRLSRLAEQHADMALGFEAAGWWSREAPPQRQTWCADAPFHLVEKQGAAKAPEAKAMACYGLYLPQLNQMRLRFVWGRPVSAVPGLFLVWLTTYFAAQGKRALVLLWANASWHSSQEVRQWRRSHNRTVKQRGGCRLSMCRLPRQSP